MISELLEWLQSIGIPLDCESADDLSSPEVKDPPNDFRNELYDRYRK